MTMLPKLPVDSHRGRINIAKALQMRLKNGLSDPEIAKYFGVSKQAVHAALKRFSELLLGPGELEAYRERKSRILESVEARLLTNLIDPKRIQKASLNNVAYALAQVSNMSRLEKGLSTSNVAYMDMTASLEEIRQQRQQLEETLESM